MLASFYCISNNIYIGSLQCYIERKTGNRFRSLVSVERYLKDPGKLADKQPMRIEYGRSRDFSLPNGWIVEGKPRSNSSQIDKVHTSVGFGILWFEYYGPTVCTVFLFADLH